MDVDSKGKLTASNLKRVLNFELGLDLSDELIQNMIDQGDFNGDGVIDEKDFVKILKKFKAL